MKITFSGTFYGKIADRHHRMPVPSIKKKKNNRTFLYGRSCGCKLEKARLDQKKTKNIMSSIFWAFPARLNRIPAGDPVKRRCAGLAPEAIALQGKKGCRLFPVGSNIVSHRPVTSTFPPIAATDLWSPCLLPHTAPFRTKRRHCDRLLVQTTEILRCSR